MKIGVEPARLLGEVLARPDIVRTGELAAEEPEVLLGALEMLDPRWISVPFSSELNTLLLGLPMMEGKLSSSLPLEPWLLWI